ncbi:MAG: hypothetical protein IT174_09845 [Acidobacteria bacterium]|nr:hypothetical protein [Acidobacteriota bacterium]
MQTQTLDKPVPKVAPYNDVAKLIDREVHNEMLEKINFLAREYEVRDPRQVGKCLRDNLFLFELLTMIPKQISKYFGKNAKLALELLSEPDFPSSQEIFVLVLTADDAETARSKMDRFDNEWWLENLDKANCRLNVSLEYV